MWRSGWDAGEPNRPQGRIGRRESRVNQRAGPAANRTATAEHMSLDRKGPRPTRSSSIRSPAPTTASHFNPAMKTGSNPLYRELDRATHVAVEFVHPVMLLQGRRSLIYFRYALR
jgi:hypothetical protein